MNNACPNCGVTGPNLNCNLHPYPYFGNMSNPCKEIPNPIIDEEKQWLFAETGRLHLSLTKANKEIERLKGLMPPDERGPGFVGQGSWSVFAEKVVAERDALREVLAGLREKGVIDQHNRPLPLEGHHKDCGHGKYVWLLCTCDELKKVDEERANKQFQLLVEHSGPVCKKCGGTGRATVTDGVVATRGWCECSKEFKALVEAGQQLRKEFDKQTAGMRGPPRCSKCGDTGWIEYFPGSRGMKRCDEACQKTSPIDQVIDELIKDDRETCDHGNTECKRCGVGQPTRDHHQDLKVGDIVRFEVEGVITDRQPGGIVIKDYEGNDYEPVQYVIRETFSGNKCSVPYYRILAVIGEEE